MAFNYFSSLRNTRSKGTHIIWSPVTILFLACERRRIVTAGNTSAFAGYSFSGSPQYIKFYHQCQNCYFEPSHTPSAYQVKHDCRLFERLFKVKKYGVFVFGISFFRFRDITVFVLCKWGTWWRHQWLHLNNKILNLEYLQKYWSSVLQSWHQKRTSQKKQSDTYYDVATAILLVPVSFCEKANIPICR